MFAAINFASCILGLALTPGPSRVALFWPASGIVAGALLVAERRRWAALLVAASVPIAAFNLAAGQAVTVVVGFAGTNIMYALASVYLTLRFCGGRPRFENAAHVLAFIAGGPVIATGCFEAPAAAMLSAVYGYPFLDIWTGLWAGSGLGMLTVGSLILAWSDRTARTAPVAPSGLAERSAFTLLFAVALGVVFLRRTHAGPFSHEILLLPLLVWAALRFGIRGATAIGVVMTLVVLGATVAGRGFFAHSDSPTASAVAAQVFCAIAFLTELFMASIVETHRRDTEALRQSEKLEAIGRLAGGVAHDFNNQLTGILSGVEHLRAALRHERELHEVADEIRDGALRSTRLVRQLLAFSRKEPPRATSVDVHAVVGDVVALLSRSIDKRIALRTELLAQPELVRGDPDRLHSALLNLALNARDAMPEGGTLTFLTRVLALDAARCAALSPFELEPGPYVEICVRDTGTGLTDEARAHLFEPYFTTKPVGKGSGLGLPEVYGTVKAYRGAVRVESASPRGTAVTLLLPASQGASRSTPRDDGVPAPAAPPRVRVLVVDDELNVRRSLGLLLRTGGHEIIECDRGHEALARCAAQRDEIDVAIVDMMMPDMTGRELVARLRAVCPRLPVIISSGYSASSDLEALLAEPGVTSLPKPYTTDELHRALLAALQGAGTPGSCPVG